MASTREKKKRRKAKKAQREIDRRAKFNKKKGTTIANVMLATSYGTTAKQTSKIGSIVMEEAFQDNGPRAGRDWFDLLDPWGLKGYGPSSAGKGAGAGRKPIAPLSIAESRRAGAGGFTGSKYQGKSSYYRSTKNVDIGKTPAGTGLIRKSVAILGGTASAAATGFWVKNQLGGGNDNGTQLILNFLEDVMWAVYIDDRLITVLNQEAYDLFIGNMKRNLQLRTRALRSD